MAVRAARAIIRLDDEPDFISNAIVHRIYANGVTWAPNRPGKPIDNPSGGLFDVRSRGEYLNARWFPSLTDTRAKFETDAGLTCCFHRRNAAP